MSTIRRQLAVLGLAALAAGAHADILVHSTQADFGSGQLDSTAVLAPGSVVVDSHGFVVYTRSGVDRPLVRSWDGEAFGPELSGLDAGAAPLSRIDGAAGTRRHEFIVSAIDADGRLSVQVFDGTGFGSQVVLREGPQEPGANHAAVAFESRSGRALVVYERGNGTPWYRIWDGQVWSGEQAVGLDVPGEPTRLELVSDPGSDRLLLVAVDGASSQVGNAAAILWDGTGWSGAVELQSDGQVRDESPVAAFLPGSGAAMVVWASAASTSPRYRVWSDGWLPEGALAPTGSNPPRQLRLASDPDSDRLALVAVTTGTARNVYVYLFDGSNWDAGHRLTGNAPAELGLRAHVQFVRGSGEVLAIYQHSTSTNLRFERWDGASWVGGGPVTAIGGVMDGLEMTADAHSVEVALSWLKGATQEAGVAWWNGSSWVGSTSLASLVGIGDGMPLRFLFDRHPPLFVSDRMDAGTPNTPWGSLEWAQAGDGSLRFQVAVANGTGFELEDFVGPDGTSDSWFTAANSSPLPPGMLGRYARYRVEFQRGPAGGEPELLQVSLVTGEPPPIPGFVVRTIADPKGPQDLASADFDLDGWPDIVTVHPSEDVVSLLLGTGGGGLDTPRHFAAGSAPIALQSADMNNDGLPDVVTVGSSSPEDVTLPTGGQANVLLGDGAGAFLPPLQFAAGSGPLGIVVLDTDRDGNQDVVISDPERDSIVLLDGDGSGNLGPASYIAVGSGPFGLISDDFDGDGIADIAFTLPELAGVGVMHGDGVGGFGPMDFFAAGSGPLGLASGDLDLDGWSDLVLSDPHQDQVLVLRNSGGLGFEPARDFQTGSAPVAVITAELNGDCRPDVATADVWGETISVLVGDGSGGLGLPASFAVGGAPSALRALDLDLDLDVDIGGTLPQQDQIVILDNETPPQLSFLSQTFAQSCEGQSVSFVPEQGVGFDTAARAVWDFGDGTPPLVVAGDTLVVEHEYDKPGNYLVNLRLEDAFGRCLAQHTTRQRVTAAVSADSGGPYAQCVEPGQPQLLLTLDASGSSSRDAASLVYRWSLPDLVIDAGSSPLIELQLDAPAASVGLPLTLEVSDGLGCSDSVETSLSLLRPAEPQLSGPQTPVCAGQTVTLDAGPGWESYLWSTGDTGRSTSVTPTDTGVYSVSVSDSNGCRAEAELLLEVVADDPVALGVPNLRAVKGGFGRLVFYHGQIGAPGYNLHRAETASELSAAPVVALVEGEGPLSDTPPTGQPELYYQIRGASACSHTSGP